MHWALSPSGFLLATAVTSLDDVEACQHDVDGFLVICIYKCRLKQHYLFPDQGWVRLVSGIGGEAGRRYFTSVQKGVWVLVGGEGAISWWECGVDRFDHAMAESG